MTNGKMISYSAFADDYAQLVGEAGSRVAAAMRSQLDGTDTDVAEINWQVQVASADNTNERFANVQADLDRQRLHFTLDERDSVAIDAPSMTTHDFVLWLGERQEIESGSDVVELQPDRLREELARFRMASEGQR